MCSEFYNKIFSFNDCIHMYVYICVYIHIKQIANILQKSIKHIASYCIFIMINNSPFIRIKNAFINNIRILSNKNMLYVICYKNMLYVICYKNMLWLHNTQVQQNYHKMDLVAVYLLCTQGRQKRSGWSGFGRTSFDQIPCIYFETLCKKFYAYN